LLGNPVRYDGSDLLIEHPLLKQWRKEKRLISICPEVAGGMTTPRPPAEIITHKPYQIINNKQQDVTDEFLLGAKKTLALALDNNCMAAIMTERSPSCGNSMIYDGSFSGKKIVGMGVTASLLKENGIQVFNQYQIELLESFLKGLE